MARRGGGTRSRARGDAAARVAAAFDREVPLEAGGIVGQLLRAERAAAIAGLVERRLVLEGLRLLALLQEVLGEPGDLWHTHSAAMCVVHCARNAPWDVSTACPRARVCMCALPG